MKVKIFIPAALFLHLTFLFGIAQNNELRFKLVEGINGRPLGKINAITQDPHGYMWFAGNGENCIYRYDGARMTSFRHDDANPNSLGVHYPETIFADKKGMIWIGENGLDQFNPTTGIFKHYRHLENDPNSLALDHVFVILEDHLGRLWVGGGSGLDLFDEKTNKFVHYHNIPGDPKSLSNNAVRTIYEDRAGVIWIGTGFEFSPDESGGLNRLNPDGTFTRYLHDPNDPHSLINNKVKAIFEDSRGVFWVGTGGDGLHTMDRSTGSFERHLFDPSKPNQLSRPPVKGDADHIIFINEDKSGAIWIGTYKAGINRYDPATKKISYYQTINEAADSTCWNDFISQDGVLWICTEDSHRLYRGEPFYKPINRVSTGGVVTSFLEDKEGYLWVGSLGKGLLKYDQHKNLVQQLKNDPSDTASLLNNSVVLFQGGRDTIWVRTGKGVRIMNRITEQFTWFKGGGNLKDSTGEGISKIIRDKQGYFWFGNWGTGLVNYNPDDNSFKHFLPDIKDSSSIASNLVNIIYEDKFGTVWAGGPGGLNHLDKATGRFKHYLQGSFINSLFEDSAGNLWAGTEYGLFHYDPEKDRFSTFFDPQSPFNSFKVGGITEDNEKNLWFSSQLGIIKLNPFTKETFIYGNSFGISLSNSEMWPGAYKNSKGEIFISYENGFYTFSPEELSIKTNFKIILTDLFINSIPVLPGKGSIIQQPIEDKSDLELKYNQDNIAFNFAGIDYRKPEAIRYFTMLENYDNTWREVIGEKSSYYFNISPGKYKYRVKAYNSDGTKAEKVIAIYINPPWWETWWFRVMSVIALLAVIYAIIYERSRKFRAENIRLEEKVAERTIELKKEKEIVESTLSDLKKTQAQLIQSEKMASLGELTAGIAHEIQNPLNFVNNFSELNRELIDELEEEQKKEPRDFDNEDDILKIIRKNEQKINHHGKRADAIVKGMLEHSRTSSGEKKLSDINALADEYLRLAYHGFRAKDKSFNAAMNTSFDETIGNISIVPQDIGRVLLNLYNNAFYAAALPSKGGFSDSDKSKSPAIWVSTKKMNDKVLISVRDNGPGIPQKIIDKIFQPFFTTKPTGEGTGLGLSLSYDIIKAHGGEIRVDSTQGEGTVFFIELPV